MKKIDFVNNDAPYLSAENLNQMQDNIEEAIDENYIELLAENIESNVDGLLVNLSKDVSNYKSIILVGKGYGWCTHLTIPVPLLKLETGRFYVYGVAEGYGVNCTYVNETQVKVKFDINLSLNKIYGLK